MLGPVEARPAVVHDLTLRPVTDADLDVVTELIAAQDTAWWGEPDGDREDTRLEFERVRHASGSIEQGARLAVRSGVPVGVAMGFDHGQTTLAVDPVRTDTAATIGILAEWLLGRGATSVDSPVGDAERISVLEHVGLERERSSFELERSADVADLGPVSWPEGYVVSPFRPGVDDRELHDMIYSVWTDVPGHTDRPFDEWRMFLRGPTFDPGLVVLVRRLHDGVPGRIAGGALGRRFAGGVGWVAQLAVGRDDRGVGLGRSILVEAFRRLASRDGVGVLALGVEAQNAAALGLYRSVGLDVAREYVHLTRLRPRA